MDLQLTGKRALVTGGSRGIGRMVALELAREGADIVVAARGADALAATAEEVSSETGRHVVPVTVDTADDASVRAMAEAAAGVLGGVDILVNSAARVGGVRAPLAELTDAEVWEDLNVKVMGYLRCARAVAPGMVAQGWGRIVNISGLAARQSGSIAGSMRNVAVAAMTKNLADELGPHGVNVTVVHPGATRTEAFGGYIAAMAARQGVDPAEMETRIASINSIRRIVDASEVAAVVAFLASPRSSAINGDAVVCGGGAVGAIHY
jgi:NAD(P)-dependent dehydrogenase (short-subunit alcohol dehydrogenase family)